MSHNTICELPTIKAFDRLITEKSAEIAIVQSELAKLRKQRKAEYQKHYMRAFGAKYKHAASYTRGPYRKVNLINTKSLSD